MSRYHSAARRIEGEHAAIYQDLPHSIPEHLRTEEEIGLLQTVILEIGIAHDIPCALTAVLQRVCEKAEWTLGQAWLPNRKGTALERRAVWAGDADRGVEEFLSVSGRMGFLPGEGLPGRVWSSKRPAWLLDATQDANPTRSAAAGKAGLKAAFGIPTLAKKEVVGVLEFFVRERRAEDDRRVRMITAVSLQMGLLIQHKLAEDALWACQERYRVLAENAPVCIHEIDHEGRLIAVNPAGLRMLGAKRSELCGVSALEIASAADRPRIKEFLHCAFQGEFPEFEFRTAGPAEPRTFLSCFMPLKERDGVIRKLISISQDITEHKRAEERLRQSQKMEAVGRLAGGVAHDFNNLLSIIMGYSELLLAEIDTAHPIHERVSQIQQAANHGAWLTQQLLVFSRQQMVQPAVLDLNSVVSHITKMLRRLIGEHIELTTILDPELGRTRAERGQIEQVILNLAANARDAMPRGGKLTIQTSNIEINPCNSTHRSDVSPGRYVVLSVSDSGVGMDDATQTYIFEPFFTTKETGKGTGLGLAMVDGIVRQSGGNIRVSSKLGKGTIFQIFFPRVEGTAGVSASKLPEATLPVGSETVLLVEDAAPLRRLTREVLESCGYTVLESGDGREAIRIFRHSTRPISLLMTDVDMPGIRGPNLAEQLLAMKPELKVLFVSGCTEDEIHRLGGLPTGMPFLRKPYACSTLARKIRDILEPPVHNVSSN